MSAHAVSRENSFAECVAAFASVRILLRRLVLQEAFPGLINSAHAARLSCPMSFLPDRRGLPRHLD